MKPRTRKTIMRSFETYSQRFRFSVVKSPSGGKVLQERELDFGTETNKESYWSEPTTLFNGSMEDAVQYYNSIS